MAAITGVVIDAKLRCHNSKRTAESRLLKHSVL